MYFLIIGINFTYGWMPTILDFRSKNFEEALEILNKAKNCIIPSVENLEILKGLFNIYYMMCIRFDFIYNKEGFKKRLFDLFMKWVY